MQHKGNTAGYQSPLPFSIRFPYFLFLQLVPLSPVSLGRRQNFLLTTPAWPAYLRLSLISFFLKLGKLLGTFLSKGDADLLLLVVVKVAGVAWSFELGDEGSFHLKEGKASSWEVTFPEVLLVQTDTQTHLPFSDRWQSSQWLQTTYGPWCHWLHSSDFRNVLWDPPVK